MSTPVLAFDIETYGCWDTLSPRLQRYLERRDQKRGRDPDDPRAASRTVALLPGLAQVVAVGLWSSEAGGTSLALVPDLGTDEEREQRAGTRVVYFRREEALLRALWERLGLAAASGVRLVSFHGRVFDGPMLALRSSVLGLRPSLNLVPRRRGSLFPHCDLVDVFSFFGAQRQHMALEYWCEVYGVATPKAELTGAEVGGAFERGEYTTIAEYALRDARATAEIFRKIEPTLLASLEDPLPAYPQRVSRERGPVGLPEPDLEAQPHPARAPQASELVPADALRSSA
jgi:hypothetical protein